MKYYFYSGKLVNIDSGETLGTFDGVSEGNNSCDAKFVYNELRKDIQSKLLKPANIVITQFNLVEKV